MKKLSLLLLLMASPVFAAGPPSALPPGLQESIEINQQAAFAFGVMTGQRKLALSLLGIDVPECHDKMTLAEIQTCARATNTAFENLQKAVKAAKSEPKVKVK